MKYHVAVLAFLCGFAAASEVDVLDTMLESSRDKIILTAIDGQPRKLSDIAVDVCLKHMPRTEIVGFLTTFKRDLDFKLSTEDTMSVKRYLDEKLLEVAAGLPKDTKTLKKYVMMVGVYTLYGEPLPEYLQNVDKKYMAELENLLPKFSWENALELTQAYADEVERLKKQQKKK